MAGPIQKDGSRLIGLDELYPVEFRAWLGELMRVVAWGAAGYPIGQLDLGFEDWQAIVAIRDALAKREREEAEKRRGSAQQP